MSDKKIMLTIRATQDGVYGNYLWKGPIDSDQGYTPGEVFLVDATPYVVTDGKGNPVYDLNEDGQKIAIVDGKGKQKLDAKGKKMWKVKMATMFAKEWMERVDNDTELTYPDRPAWTIPEAYRIRKTKPGRTVPLPADVIEAAGLAVPAAVAEVMPEEEASPRETESVI